MNQPLRLIPTDPYLTNREFPLQDLQTQTLSTLKETKEVQQQINDKLDNIVGVLGNIDKALEQNSATVRAIHDTLTSLLSVCERTLNTSITNSDNTSRITAALRDESTLAKIAIANTAATPIFTAPVG